MYDYAKYRHLMSVKYDDGDHDCYGLCIRYYADVYGIELPNYARSADFFAEGVDLVTPFIEEQEFSLIDVAPSRMQVGDGLLMSIRRPWMGGAGTTNHLGVFVGNGLFIHHMYGKLSCEDPMSIPWQRRVMGVLRHPEVTLKNAEMRAAEPTDILSLVPDHVKQRYGIVS